LPILTNRSFKPGSKEVMALQADYIDENLNTFLKSLITTYSRIPWAMDSAVSGQQWYLINLTRLTNRIVRLRMLRSRQLEQGGIPGLIPLRGHHGG
jgi:hypothetical protein